MFNCHNYIFDLKFSQLTDQHGIPWSKVLETSEFDQLLKDEERDDEFWVCNCSFFAQIHADVIKKSYHIKWLVGVDLCI